MRRGTVGFCWRAAVLWILRIISTLFVWARAVLSRRSCSALCMSGCIYLCRRGRDAWSRRRGQGHADMPLCVGGIHSLLTVIPLCSRCSGDHRCRTCIRPPILFNTIRTVRTTGGYWHWRVQSRCTCRRCWGVYSGVTNRRVADCSSCTRRRHSTIHFALSSCSRHAHGLRLANTIKQFMTALPAQ